MSAVVPLNRQARRDARPKRIEDVQGVADYLKIKPRQVRNLQTKGLPHYRVGGLVRFDLDSIDDWLERHARGGDDR